MQLSMLLGNPTFLEKRYEKPHLHETQAFMKATSDDCLGEPVSEWEGLSLDLTCCTICNHRGTIMVNPTSISLMWAPSKPTASLAPPQACFGTSISTSAFLPHMNLNTTRTVNHNDLYFLNFFFQICTLYFQNFLP